MGYESDDYTIISESTIISKKKGFSMDRGNNVFHIYGNNHKISGYGTSNIPGFPIRNAITGLFEYNSSTNKPFKVGSKYEDLFFTAVLPGFGEKTEFKKMFYSNPEQCEKHLNIHIPIDRKKIWKEKYNQLLM